jgi:hypothetical protein
MATIKFIMDIPVLTVILSVSPLTIGTNVLSLNRLIPERRMRFTPSSLHLQESPYHGGI